MPEVVQLARPRIVKSILAERGGDILDKAFVDRISGGFCHVVSRGNEQEFFQKR